VGESAAVIGALIFYSRPFTERADPAVNQRSDQRQCFLSLATDLGADLRLHARLLQTRDKVIALSEIVHSPLAHVNARLFNYPDPRFVRLTRNLNRDAFRRLARSMRVACALFQAEIDTRSL